MLSGVGPAPDPWCDGSSAEVCCSGPKLNRCLLCSLCRFLLTDEQMDANTTWGPPRLATIAAAVLHRSLVADLKVIQAEQQAQLAAASGISAPDVAAQQQQQQQAAPRPAAASISPAHESSSSSVTSSAAATTGRRRWGCRHRRANSDAAHWAGRISDISPRPSNTVRRLSTGGLGRISRRGRTVSPSAAAPAVTLPGSDRINLQEALGQLSPRAFVAALVSSGGDGAAGSSGAAAAAAHTAPGPDASSSAGGGWVRLVARQVRLGAGSSRQHQQQPQQPACASPDPEDCRLQQQQAGEEPAHAAGDQKTAGCSLLRSASDSFCLVLGDAELGDGSGDKQEAKESPSGSIPAVFDSGKVSPFPDLKPDMPGGCRLQLAAGGRKLCWRHYLSLFSCLGSGQSCSGSMWILKNVPEHWCCCCRCV